MSDPLSEACVYCGSPDVLDDAWWCESYSCWWAYYRECEEATAFETRTPLTHGKAIHDLANTKACVWGTPYLAIERTLDKLLSCIYTKRVSHVIQHV